MQGKAAAFIEYDSISEQFRTGLLHIFHAVGAAALFVNGGQEVHIPGQLLLPSNQVGKGVQLHHGQLLGIQGASAPDPSLIQFSAEHPVAPLGRVSIHHINVGNQDHRLQPGMLRPDHRQQIGPLRHPADPPGGNSHLGKQLFQISAGLFLSRGTGDRGNPDQLLEGLLNLFFLHMPLHQPSQVR